MACECGDRHLIIDLLNSYATCLDARDWSGLNDVFHPRAKGVYGVELNGRDADRRCHPQLSRGMRPVSTPPRQLPDLHRWRSRAVLDQGACDPRRVRRACRSDPLRGDRCLPRSSPADGRRMANHRAPLRCPHRHRRHQHPPTRLKKANADAEIRRPTNHHHRSRFRNRTGNGGPTARRGRNRRRRGCLRGRARRKLLPRPRTRATASG